MTRVRTAKGSLYFELLGASFFLIELLASIHLLVCIWYAWVNCRISICKKLYFKALHCNVPIIIFCSLWSCCYTLEVSSSTKNQDQLLIIQVLINLLKYHLMPKGCKDVIDDEVVSLSYSYTVAIYVRTFKDLVASTSPNRFRQGFADFLLLQSTTYSTYNKKCNKECLGQRLVTFQQQFNTK